MASIPDRRRVDIPLHNKPSIGLSPTPNFRNKKKEAERREFAADVLLKLVGMARPKGLLGIVLPQSFLDSRAAAEARKAVLDHCEILEIAMFPGGVFYSHALTQSCFLQARNSGDDALSSSVRNCPRTQIKLNLSYFMKSGRFREGIQSFTRTYPVDPLCSGLKMRNLVSFAHHYWTYGLALNPASKLWGIRQLLWPVCRFSKMMRVA